MDLLTFNNVAIILAIISDFILTFMLLYIFGTPLYLTFFISILSTGTSFLIIFNSLKQNNGGYNE